MGEVERTFLMVKPDGVQRGLVGDVVQRAENKGLKVAALKMLQLDRDTAEKHYAEHRDKVFFDSLVDYVMSGPSVAMVLAGQDAIPAVRNMIGATDPVDAAPGTIRGDHALDIGRNVVHAADSPDAARDEIALYFDEDEILDYDRIDETWLYE